MCSNELALSKELKNEVTFHVMLQLKQQYYKKIYNIQ